MTSPRVSDESKTRMFKQQIIAFNNSDKKIKEKWDDIRAKDIGNFPSPFRMLLLGPPNSGKSTLIKNLILHQRPRFDEIYVIHEDASTNPEIEGTTEYDDLDATGMLNDVPDLSFWNSITAEDDPDKPLKRLVILDDLEMTSAHKSRLKNLGILFRYISSHKGFSLMLAHQNFFGIPALIKKMSNIFVVWKPVARNELALIENRVGMNKGDLAELFNEFRKNQYDSLCIDHTINTPASLRLNIFEPIDLVI